MKKNKQLIFKSKFGNIVTINDSIVLITQSNCLKLIQSGHAFPFGDKND